MGKVEGGCSLSSDVHDTSHCGATLVFVTLEKQCVLCVCVVIKVAIMINIVGGDLALLTEVFISHHCPCPPLVLFLFPAILLPFPSSPWQPPSYPSLHLSLELTLLSVKQLTQELCLLLPLFLRG